MAAGVLGPGIVNVVNKLQDVFVTIGTSMSQIDLPHVCVLGSQGSGESVLLEVSIVFLPSHYALYNGSRWHLLVV